MEKITNLDILKQLIEISEKYLGKKETGKIIDETLKEFIEEMKKEK